MLFSEGAAVQESPRFRFSVYSTLLSAFAGLVLIVLGIVLYMSYLESRSEVLRTADEAMSRARSETSANLRNYFDPILRRMTADYWYVRAGMVHRHDRESLKNLFFPALVRLPQSGSMMVGDETGYQFLVMKYDSTMTGSPLLEGVDGLPVPVSNPPQFFTREFRADEWGQNSVWNLWSQDGSRPVKTWEKILPDYNPRQRLWYRLALENYRDMGVTEFMADPWGAISWTDVYTLFTTKTPGISASVAAVDPSGEKVIIAYDMLLEDLNRFTRTAHPTRNGLVFLFTESGDLLGIPGHRMFDSEAVRAEVTLKPVVECGLEQIADAMKHWRPDSATTHQPSRYRTGGETWLASFQPFQLGPNRRILIGVVAPESDLMASARRLQGRAGLIAALAFGIGILIAAGLSRWIARPLSELARLGRRIASLDLSPSPRVQSRVREVDELSSSLEAMRVSLDQTIRGHGEAEQKLRDSRDFYLTLLEDFPLLVWRTGPDGRCDYFNQTWSKFTGRTILDVKREGWAMGVYPEDRESCRAEFRAAIESRKPFKMEYRMRRHDGAWRWVIDWGRPYNDLDGNFAGYIGALEEVHEVKESNQALMESEKRFRSLVENAGDAFFLCDLDGRLVDVNQQASQSLGYDRRDLLVLTLGDIDESWSGGRRAEFSTMAPGDFVTMPGHHRRRDGSTFPVETRAGLIDLGGRPFILCLARDASERRLMEEQLRQAQKMEAVGRLAGGVAHDFNNLLTAIFGYTEMARRGKSEGERRASLENITRTAERAAALTRQLLAFARRQISRPRSIGLTVMVRDLDSLLRRLIGEDVRIVLDLAPETWNVSADPGNLEQVIVNLAVNARDAMPDGGTITLSTRNVRIEDGAAGFKSPPGDYVLLEVKDTGSGIPADVLPHIFEPFFTTKEVGKGTGLGLSTCYGIIEQASGYMAVENSPEGGVVVRIHLPRDLSAAAPDAAPEAVPAGSGGNETILLVEDEGMVRDLLIQALREQGYTVLPAGDGHAALELSRRHDGPIDLLITDVVMPGMGGTKLAEAVTAERPGIDVLFISGYNEESIFRDGVQAGRITLLEKPFSPSALNRKVREFLDGHGSA